MSKRKYTPVSLVGLIEIIKYDSDHAKMGSYPINPLGSKQYFMNMKTPHLNKLAFLDHPHNPTSQTISVKRNRDCLMSWTLHHMPLHPKENLHSPKAVPSIIWDHLATTGCGRWQPKIVQNPRIDRQYIAKFFALQSNPQINCQYIANFSALHSASVQRSLCRNNIKLSNWIALTEAWGIFKVREDLLCYL